MNRVDIIIELHPKQYVGHNKWKCTIDGEERLVTCQKVRFCADSFENITSKFVLDECVDIQMCLSRGFSISPNGNKIYHD